MSKGNLHKKRTFIDRFARRFFCQHARLNYLRSDKLLAKRKERRYGNQEPWMQEYDDFMSCMDDGTEDALSNKRFDPCEDCERADVCTKYDASVCCAKCMTDNDGVDCDTCIK